MCQFFSLNNAVFALFWHRERQQQLDELRKNLEKVQEEADVLRSQLVTVQRSTQVHLGLQLWLVSMCTVFCVDYVLLWPVYRACHHTVVTV